MSSVTAAAASAVTADRRAVRATATLAAAAVAAAVLGCGRPEPEAARFSRLENGDAERGRVLVARYQCGGCHTIPGVPGAGGRTGPPLEGIGARSFLAGEVPNVPSALARWIREPRALVPDTTMPDMGASVVDARDMAAYLLTLR